MSPVPGIKTSPDKSRGNGVTPGATERVNGILGCTKQSGSAKIIMAKTKTFLRFQQVPAPGTTSIYDVLSAAAYSQSPLGVIKWRSGWRRYVFLPEVETVFDAGCLTEIVEFINGLMAARKTPIVARTPEEPYDEPYGDGRE